ncbi:MULTISPECIES: phospholipase D-like domain-containing protein [unclassified Streptomyces]|uniref:phospholipase D-like domain-containing protein n=1 Tax=unclassified Streptomyces TaxID=2593676 RepID=UPI0022592B68|nr:MULTISPECIES: phospholipase D-like domain-containing protein [unclassified Streptomyces]MCX5055911.1 phospholipase D-like domain-containing protein [Streptomyces sp. NBC_00452]MCX5247234.1 phospholipase D-like domain-containing protein [Streptomyces sp. NBC_00201]MCX5287004.1 phospholipase D-like domain-containing protein [Streptomyces sp. NBC_00183]
MTSSTMGPRAVRCLRTLPSVVAAVLSLVAALLLGSATPAAAAPVKPVINGPVFNDPLGTPAQQKAIFTQLVQLIDATPAGAQIRGSMYEFNDQEVANALLAANSRGVDVKLIVDDSSYVGGNGAEYTNPSFQSLKSGLGTNDAARSWIAVCDDKFEDADGVDDVSRGCLAVAPPGPAYAHNKFFVFSKIGPFDDGTSYSKVVFQTSSNLGDWYKVESFNDSVTFADSTVYNNYVTYHEMLRQGRSLARGNNHAYFSTPTGSTYRAFFFPRGDASYYNPATDTVVGALDQLSCAYTGADGKRHQTDVRIVVHSFFGSRVQVAEKLAQLKAQGCWIDILYAETDSTITTRLNAAGIQHRKCLIPNGPGIDVRPHNKEILIDGAYDGDITPRVYTGSANLTGSSLRSADEVVLRITSASYHAKYLSTFYKIRAACGG